MTPPPCPRCGTWHAANHPTGERACLPRPAYPRAGLVMIALFLALCALYLGAQIGRWIA